MSERRSPLIDQHLSQLRELCDQYGVERLELFGSGTGASFKPDSSDLDFIVQMRNPRQPGYARRFCGFADALEHLFGRRVDLLTDAMIRNPVFKAQVDQSRELVVGH